MRPHLLLVPALAIAVLAGASAAARTQTCCQEPSATEALGWWAPPRGVWTPIGWPDHLFRFQVVYNGTLLCAPVGWFHASYVRKYKEQSFQLNFHPSPDGNLSPLPREETKLYKVDGGTGIQGWRDDKETPVLWTDWPCQEGVVLRQEVFAHLKGARNIAEGTEPLYAWIRLSVAHVDPLRAPQRFSFAVQLSRVYYELANGGTGVDSVYLAVRPEKSGFADSLTSTTIAHDQGHPGLRVDRSDGKAQLLVLPGGAGTLSLAETSPQSGLYNLRVELPVQKGASTDLLVPMLPVSPDALADEAAHGFDGALAECESFWKAKPATAARIHTPETYINDALARNIQFAQVITQRNPDNGDYTFLSGSYGYEALWSTPTSMISHMFFDLLGYHETVERHIRLYKRHQGTVRPPGPSYVQHPGYFSTPRTLTAIDWLTDHGAILETLSRHALLSGDERFISEWLDPILKACDFIKDSCNSTNHDGVRGLMPPAVATDTEVPIQGVWNQAWTYKGLVTSVELLERLGHPRAPEFRTFASAFRVRFEEAFRTAIAKEPEWIDAQGNRYPVLPASLTPIPRRSIGDDPFLLDAGPLVLPWAGLFDAHDPLMRSFADFFRVGPNTKLRGPQTGPVSRAVLTRELSSCEPCYSWNIVNSWKTGDREKFLEGMYALFTGAVSPQTFINCENPNAMFGNVFVAPLMTWCLRQAVIDDQLVPGELHLLRLCPLAWASSTEETIFEGMPTSFGPVNLRLRKSEDGKTLHVTFSGEWREKPKRILLHSPPVPGLGGVMANGRRYSAGKPIELVLQLRK